MHWLSVKTSSINKHVKVNIPGYNICIFIVSYRGHIYLSIIVCVYVNYLLFVEYDDALNICNNDEAKATIHTALGLVCYAMENIDEAKTHLFQRYVHSHCEHIYYRFIVRFPMGLGFLFITFLLHFFLSWTSSLLMSSSAISASTLSNHVLLGLPTGLLPSTLNSIHFFTQSSLHVHTISFYHF